MITPRRTRLVRVPDLHALRHAVAIVSTEGPVELARSRVVVVPSQGAASQLKCTIEKRLATGAGANVFPDLVTRQELYDRLRSRLPRPPHRLTPCEREVVFQAAAAGAIAAGVAPPFQLRPGLVAEMVRFYDQLRRQRQTVDRFEALLVESLDGEQDRGADRLLRQTRFLAASYRAYEKRLIATGTADEHVLRDHLVRFAAADPLRHVVVTVADWIADPDGLAAADFDLLARIPHVERIDIVATDGLLRSGFNRRIHDWLPGIEEVDGEVLDISPSPAPRLLTPEAIGGGLVFLNRDREEELVSIARRVKREAPTLERLAIVFERPLPYLYIAPEVFGAAGIPYQTTDALPLAAEPIAAALDLVVEFVSSQFTRDATVALLRSPHFQFEDDGRPATRAEVAALDRAMSEARYLGELDSLRALESSVTVNADALAALRAAIRVADELQPLLVRAPASTQLTKLAVFLTSHANASNDDERSLRGRTTLVRVLQSLAAAHAVHDDREATIDDLVPDIRRWVEEERFAPAAGGVGIQLLDAQAARFGEFDDIVLVGLIEGEWPERPRRNIFYPPSLLAALGWPSEQDRRGAATAGFLDLVRSASRSVALSTITLDDEALVAPSSLVDELPGDVRLKSDAAAGLKTCATTVPAQNTAVAQDFSPADSSPVAQDFSPANFSPVAQDLSPAVASGLSRTFVDEALSIEPVDLDNAALDSAAREWAVMRKTRTDAGDPRYHGAAGPRPLRPLSVSAIETYLACPFKFFAQHVLRLEEERDDEEVMDPKQQGRFVHDVFEAFFSSWQARGHRAITAGNIQAAREIFAEVVEERLKRLPEAEAALERTRLLGSPVAAGLGDVVFRMEADRDTEVVERLLEYPLEGEFEFTGPNGPRTLALRGIADRLDLLADGTMRLIDYKLSSTPAKARALQLPIYGLCAEQRLRHHNGRTWVLGEAAYITFRGARRVTPLFTARTDRQDVLASAQERLIAAVDRIERGEFPPTPDDVFLCGFCGYSSVCRKDYVGDV